jgi:hypothetical protein
MFSKLHFTRNVQFTRKWMYSYILWCLLCGWLQQSFLSPRVKSWEELIAYFHLVRHEPHRKRRFQQLFVAAGTSLPSCYLATIGDTETHESNNTFIVACIHCRGNVFMEQIPSVKGGIYSAETLSSNDMGIHTRTHRLMGGVYAVRCWDGCRCHDIHTKFHTDWFRHSKFIRGDSQTTYRSHTPTYICQSKGK